MYPDIIPNIEATLGVFAKPSTPNTLDFCHCPSGPSGPSGLVNLFHVQIRDDLHLTPKEQLM